MRPSRVLDHPPVLIACPLRLGSFELGRAAGVPAFASEQGIEAPGAAALRGHVQEDETEQDGRYALVLNGPHAIRRVKLLAKDATPVRLTLRPDGLELVAVTQDVGQAREDLEAKYEGTEMVVAFNPEFLIDGVEAIPGDEVQLETLDALKPATVRPTGGSEYLYLLMPVRVS